MNGQPRRIPLSSADAPTIDVKPRKKDKRPKSCRFSLSLSEPGSTVSSYKEYSLGSLLKGVKRDFGENVEDRPRNPFGDNNEVEMAQLARQFEERYGLGGNTNRKKKKKKPSKYRDLVDLGDGYDDSDSFIDNAEAYDECVPYTITTKNKGFYMNVGRLEFRDISSPDEASISSADEHKKSLPMQKARPLDSSESSSSESSSLSSSSEDETEEKSQRTGKENKKMAAIVAVSASDESSDSSVPRVKKRPREEADDQLKLKKNKLMKERSQLLKKGKFSNKSLPQLKLKSKPVALDKRNVKANQGNSSTDGSSPTVRTSAIVISDDSCSKVKLKDVNAVSKSGAALEGKSSPIKQYVSSSSPGNLSLKGESKSPMSAELKPAHAPPGRLSKVVINGKSVANDSTDTAEEAPEVTKKIPPLPSRISIELSGVIDELKKRAHQFGDSGKSKFFTSDINELLLRVELESRMMNTSSRTSIYAHLGSFLPCGAQTLIKRGKKLAVELENGPPKVKTPLIRLKEYVDSEMIGQQQKYHAELEKAKKRREELKNSAEGVMTTVGNAVNSEDCTSQKKVVETALEKKRIVGPRKKFLWNSECRGRLRAVVNSKLKQLNLTKDDARESEQFSSWCSDQVVMLWPKGWMTVKILLRESCPVKKSGEVKADKSIAAQCPGSTPVTSAQSTFQTLMQEMVTSLSTNQTASPPLHLPNLNSPENTSLLANSTKGKSSLRGKQAVTSTVASNHVSKVELSPAASLLKEEISSYISLSTKPTGEPGDSTSSQANAATCSPTKVSKSLLKPVSDVGDNGATAQETVSHHQDELSVRAAFPAGDLDLSFIQKKRHKKPQQPANPEQLVKLAPEQPVKHAPQQPSKPASHEPSKHAPSQPMKYAQQPPAVHSLQQPPKPAAQHASPQKSGKSQLSPASLSYSLANSASPPKSAMYAVGLQYSQNHYAPFQSSTGAVSAASVCAKDSSLSKLAGFSASATSLSTTPHLSAKMAKLPAAGVTCAASYGAANYSASNASSTPKAQYQGQGWSGKSASQVVSSLYPASYSSHQQPVSSYRVSSGELARPPSSSQANHQLSTAVSSQLLQQQIMQSYQQAGTLPASSQHNFTHVPLKGVPASYPWPSNFSSSDFALMENSLSEAAAIQAIQQQMMQPPTSTASYPYVTRPY